MIGPVPSSLQLNPRPTSPHRPADPTAFRILIDHTTTAAAAAAAASYRDPADAWDRKEIEYVQGDISDRDHVFRVVSGADCVWHNAAAVGPYHPEEVYYKVNYEGTLHVIDACKHHGCKKLVFSSVSSGLLF